MKKSNILAIFMWCMLSAVLPASAARDAKKTPVCTQLDNLDASFVNANGYSFQTSRVFIHAIARGDARWIKIQDGHMIASCSAIIMTRYADLLRKRADTNGIVFRVWSHWAQIITFGTLGSRQ
jgi:hypothetical protein